MKKIFFIAITFLVCLIFGAVKEWLGFTTVYLILTPKPLRTSLLWEIPMGVLICNIAAFSFKGEAVMLIRFLIPIGAALFACFRPRKLIAFFMTSVIALYFKNIYSIAFLCASLWCGAKYVFERPQETNYLEA